ncbi:MAG TPA: chemotaxis protein CheB [Desulfobacteraceae bacterium]|nr:chemotaxis protein CheB [Desulfobacteraceae bacterium]
MTIRRLEEQVCRLKEPVCQNHEAVVIGVSAGGMKALEILFSRLKKDCNLAFIVVQHVSPGSDEFFVRYLNERSVLTVKQADEKETIKKGYVYIAPPDYHLLIEEDRTFSLSVDEKVNYARPCIDITFETAAFAFDSSLIGIVLTGANRDGSQGLKKIKEKGGIAIVQDPKTAEVPVMPREAIHRVKVDHILSLEEIAVFLNNYCRTPDKG